MASKGDNPAIFVDNGAKFHSGTSPYPLPSILVTPPSTDSLQEETLLQELDFDQIEQLGRQRPEQLTSVWREIGFIFSVTMSQLLSEYFISGFPTLVPTVSQDLSIPAASETWPTSVFPLVVGSFLLSFGRVADMYGGYPVYMAGATWTCIWSCIGGFSRNQVMLDICRALQGLGAAAYLPAGLTLLGTLYRPGPRKNLVFGCYAAMAPLGLYSGVLVAGLAGEYASWPWYFYIGALLGGMTVVSGYLTIPSDRMRNRNHTIKMDWLGGATSATGLILIVFSITNSANSPQGWKSPYIYGACVSGIAILCLAFYIEGWVAEQPLLPFELFHYPYMRPLVLALLLSYGTVGIHLLYSNLYIINVMGVSYVLLPAWYTPMGVGGCFFAIVSGYVLHRVPGTALLVLTGIAIMAASLLFALLPDDANYWAWILPAMIFATIAIDPMFNVANIFFSTTLPAHQQGLAGALSNALYQLSVSLLQGVAAMVSTHTSYQGRKSSYQNAFWLEFACGASALVIFATSVRIGRAKSDLTADEKREILERGGSTAPAPNDRASISISEGTM